MGIDMALFRVLVGSSSYKKDDHPYNYDFHRSSGLM